MGISLTRIPDQATITKEEFYPNPKPWEALVEVVVIPEKKVLKSYGIAYVNTPCIFLTLISQLIITTPSS